MKISKTIIGGGGNQSRYVPDEYAITPQTELRDAYATLKRGIYNTSPRNYINIPVPDNTDYRQKARIVTKFIQRGAPQSKIYELIYDCFYGESLEYFNLLIPHLVNPLSLFQSILHYAPTQTRLVMANTMIDNGVDVNAITDMETGQSLLLNAIDDIDEYTQDYAFVELLINRGADVNTHTNEHSSGDSPLHIAVRLGFKKFVNFLISRGANVNATNTDGYTPLMLACRTKRIDEMMILVENGADIDLVANNGYRVKNDEFYIKYLQELKKKTDNNVNNMILALSGRRPRGSPVPSDVATIPLALSGRQPRGSQIPLDLATIISLEFNDPTRISDAAIKIENRKNKTKKGGKRRQKSRRQRK